MDLQTLKAQHPDVYAAAVSEGVEKERDRVVAHLTAGEMSGDVVTASKAIKEGSEMTATLQTGYMMAAANRGTVTATETDTAAAAAAVEGAVETDEQREALANNRLLAACAEACGVELEVDHA